MSLIRSKNTKPEIQVRHMLAQNGIRGYRLHYNIVGRPDIVFTKKRIAIFVDGCFWHGCKVCYNKPLNNAEYWEAKISRNQKRDIEVNNELRSLGFRVIRLKEHDITRRSNQIKQCLVELIDKVLAS